MRSRLLVLATSLALTAFTTPAAWAQDDTPEPVLTVSVSSAEFDEVVVVSGTGWLAGALVRVEICGSEDLLDETSCDPATARRVNAGADGSLSAMIHVGIPPVPCPCVFRATEIVSGVTSTIDFELRDSALTERRLDVTDARLRGSGPWTALFGARPTRTLTFTVVNTGFVTVNNPNVVLAFGKGNNPTGFVAPPTIPSIEPGESVTVSVAVEFPMFAVGTYAVVGSIPGFDQPVEFRAESSHIPWLLLLLPVLILAQLTLVALRNRVRRRLHGPDVIDLGDRVPEAADADSEVIDVREEAAAPVDVDLTDTETAEPVDVDLTQDDVEPAAQPDELETIIGEELASVFDDAFSHRDEIISDADFRDLIVDLAGTAAGRVAERTELSDTERRELDSEIAEAVLGAFGFEPNASV